MMRTRFADPIRASSPPGLHQQAGHMTASGAYLTFDEGKKGSLEPGKLADLVVLTADPLTVDDAGLRDISATMTMVGGKIVHETPNWHD